MTLGDRITDMRQKRNLTQEDLAKSIGITRAALSHYEKNRREPDLDTLDKLAKFFVVSVDYLLGRVDNREQLLDEVQREFYDNVELDEETKRKLFTFTVDGREATEEEVKEAEAYIRARRIMKEQKNE